MIEKSEVLALAGTLDLRPDTIEKDYVLGWVLFGIRKHARFKDWAFKGGTSLKKCHFETFRFSEDLDFTVLRSADLAEDVLVEGFSTISKSLQENTGIEFDADRL